MSPAAAGPVLVQFVQHLTHPPVELAAWPDGDRSTRLVFITRNIAERQVRELFAAVRALTSASKWPVGGVELIRCSSGVSNLQRGY